MISCIVSYTCNAVFFSAHSSQCRWHETLILRMSTRIFLQLDLGWSKNHQLATSTRVIQKVTESYTLLLEHVCLFYMRWHSSWGCQHESFCSLIWAGAKTINWPHPLGWFKKLQKVILFYLNMFVCFIWHETLILRMSMRIFLQLDLSWSKKSQEQISHHHLYSEL